MAKKTYIISFDKGGILDDFNYKKFHATLTKANGVISWWHYLESCYIIVVDYNITAAKIAEFVKQHIGKKKFFVCELNLINHNGMLQPEAWEWINKHSNPNINPLDLF